MNYELGTRKENRVKILNFIFQKSFTLTELFIIVSIIGILTLIVIPAFRIYYPTLQLSGAIRNLTSDLRYAQQLAVTEQIVHGIRFSFATREYWIIEYGETEEILASSSLPEKVSFYEISGFTNNEVKFNPYGAAKESGRITLINAKNETTTIEVRPSGFVKIIK